MRASGSRSAGGYTLVEMMVVAVIIGVVLAMATSLCLAARSRLARVSGAARSQADAARASAALAHDIRSVRTARRDEGALVLSGGEAGEVRWAVSGGRLERRAGGATRTFSVPASAMRLRIDAGLVEVSVMTAAPLGKGSVPLYVAARPRVRGGGK